MLRAKRACGLSSVSTSGPLPWKTERVSSAELAKAVKQFTAGTLATRKTMEGQAQDLGGNWMLTHDLNFSERYLAAVRRLTPEDLRRAANEAP